MVKLHLKNVAFFHISINRVSHHTIKIASFCLRRCWWRQLHKFDRVPASLESGVDSRCKGKFVSSPTFEVIPHLVLLIRFQFAERVYAKQRAHIQTVRDILCGPTEPSLIDCKTFPPESHLRSIHELWVLNLFVNYLNSVGKIPNT